MARVGSIRRMAMVWQPIPPPAIWPSRRRVERLWGQPLQNAAGRAGDDGFAVAGGWWLVAGERSVRFRTVYRTFAILSGSSSPIGGKWDFPRTIGWDGWS